jgi:predicted metalloenzyme YecM
MDRIEFEKLSKEFLTQFFSLVEDHYKIDTLGLEIDHICWRCASQEDYVGMETKLLTIGSLFHKNRHNGRPISLIELDKPIIFRDQHIKLIELPAPKKGKDYLNGFEHAEFVFSKGLGTLVNMYSALPWNTKNIEKAINPDVKLRHEGITLKFHPYSLAHVVKNLEQD